MTFSPIIFLVVGIVAVGLIIIYLLKKNMFNLFKKKAVPLRPLLDEALRFKMITEEEYLRISAQRAADKLDIFLEQKGRKTPKPAKKSGA